MYKDGTLHNAVNVEFTGIEHYITHNDGYENEHYLAIWNVVGQNIT